MRYRSQSETMNDFFQQMIDSDKSTRLGSRKCHSRPKRRVAIAIATGKGYANKRSVGRQYVSHN